MPATEQTPTGVRAHAPNATAFRFGRTAVSGDAGVATVVRLLAVYGLTLPAAS
jgi:hypothetical protein